MNICNSTVGLNLKMTQSFDQVNMLKLSIKTPENMLSVYWNAFSIANNIKFGTFLHWAFDLFTKILIKGK